MKVFINWFINCSCCIWFFTMASSAPVSFSPWLWRVSTVSWERADSSSSCSFRGALEVLAHFLSSLCLLFLSLFLFWPNIAKDCSNCAPNWSCLCPFLCGFSQNLKNARKCLAWILHHNWRSQCLFTLEQNLFCCRMVRFFCCLLCGYDYDPLPLYSDPRDICFFRWHWALVTFPVLDISLAISSHNCRECLVSSHMCLSHRSWTNSVSSCSLHFP